MVVFICGVCCAGKKTVTGMILNMLADLGVQGRYIDGFATPVPSAAMLRLRARAVELAREVPVVTGSAWEGSSDSINFLIEVVADPDIRYQRALAANSALSRVEFEQRDEVLQVQAACHSNVWHMRVQNNETPEALKARLHQYVQVIDQLFSKEGK